MPRSIYMDCNATVPVRPEAAAAVAEALAVTGNASSVHGFGRAARRLIEEAREAVAALVGAVPEEVIFTSSGSEANNLALGGCGRARLLVSAGEHDSVLRAVPEAKRIPLRHDGRVDLDALATLLAESDEPALVSVMLANNETGVIQPLAEVAELARRHGALLHCDAVQAAGKLPLGMTALGIDLMSLSAHKLGGPQGIGALVVAERVALAPLIRGGGQERRRRAGTENLPGIAGFGAAARVAAGNLTVFAGLAVLRDDLETRLGRIAPDMTVFGTAAPRLANTSCFTMPGTPAETQVMALDLAGIAVSAGAACSSGKLEPSQVLRAMGASESEAGQAIRVSLGWRSEATDIEAFVAAWGQLYQRRAAARRAERQVEPHRAAL
ncbi:MAG: cysteine desulfurase family protein [Kiloniellales bacterium]